MDVALFFLVMLVAYQFKHFFADYILQGEYMLGKFKEKGWVMPLAAHAGVHAAYTLVISAMVLSELGPSLVLAAIDFGVHFAMDRLKASPSLLGRWKPLEKSAYANMKFLSSNVVHENTREKARARLRDNSLFWWTLGFDQMVHHLTHYAIIYYLVTHS